MNHFQRYLAPLSSTIKKLSELDPSEKNLKLRMLDFFLQIVNSLN